MYHHTVLVVITAFLLLQHGVQGIDVQDLLKQWVGNEAAVLVACYNDTWSYRDTFWIKRLPWSVLTSCDNWSTLLEVLKLRASLNIQTTAIVSNADYQFRNLSLILNDYSRYTYLVTWVLLLATPFNASVFTAQVPHRTSCNLIVIETRGITAIKSSIAKERFWNCTTREIQEYDKAYSKISESKIKNSFQPLFGKKITIGCRHLSDRTGESVYNKCPVFMRVREALRLCNVSLEYVRVGHNQMAASLLQKRADIYASHVALSLWRLQELDFPVITRYTHLTFYVRANATRHLHFGTVMRNSWFVLLLLGGSLLLCFVVLLVMDRLDDSRPGYETAVRTLFFLMASFYANSTRMPVASRWQRSRNLLVLFWLIGTFSLTIYIDGELVSWLSVKVPSDSIDTLEKVTKALEKRTMWPCVISTSVYHFLSMNSGEHTLVQALHRSYGRLRERMLRGSIRECLRCATREDAVCLTGTVDPCFVRKVGSGIKPGEVFGQLFASTPVRKDFPLKRAYRKLVMRLDETGWPDEEATTRICQLNERVHPVTEESLAVESLYLLYFACITLCSLILILEVLFHRNVTPSCAFITNRLDKRHSLHFADKS